MILLCRPFEGLHIKVLLMTAEKETSPLHPGYNGVTLAHKKEYSHMGKTGSLGMCQQD